MNGQAIDPRVFRQTLGHYASGITVVSGMVDSQPVGFTCQSFYSVSVDPPLISLCVMLTSTSWPKIRETGRFCVNVLAGEQHTISDRFAKSGTDKWAGVPWTLNGAGNPAIDDALIWVDCTLHSEHVAGDHLIVLGRIEELSGAEHSDGKKPLIFFKGSYHQLAAG